MKLSVTNAVLFLSFKCPVVANEALLKNGGRALKDENEIGMSGKFE